MTHLESIFQRAAEAFNPNSDELFRPVPVAVTFSTPNEELPMLFTEAMGIEENYRLGGSAGSVVGFMVDGDDMFKAFRERVRKFQSVFNSVLLKQPFDPNWLDSYLECNNMGITDVFNPMPDKRPEHIDDLYTELDLIRQGQVVSCLEDVSVRSARQQAADMTFDQMTDDLSDFIVDNCENVGLERQVRRTVVKALRQFDKGAKNVVFVDSRSARPILAALDAWSLEHGTECEESLMDMRIKRESIENRGADDRLTLNHVIATEVDAMLCEAFPDLTVKGLDSLMKDPDYQVEPATPFKGLLTSTGLTKYHGRINIDQRMDPKRLRHGLERNQIRVHRELANGIVQYASDILRLKHDYAYEQSLRNLSKSINDVSYTKSVLNLVQETKPGLATPSRSQEPDSPGLM